MCEHRCLLLLKEALELFDSSASVTRNTAHGQSIHWIVPANSQAADSVGDDDVFAAALCESQPFRVARLRLHLS